MTAAPWLIRSLTDPPPADLERRLHRPPQRLALFAKVAGFADLALGQRWLVEVPEAIVMVDNDTVEVVLYDDEAELLLPRLWYGCYFVDKWTPAVELDFDELRRALLG